LSEYDQALTEFKEAYRLMPDVTFLYNIAQCHRKLGHIDEALTFYKTYRRRAPNAPNREEINRRITELEAEQQARKEQEGRQGGAVAATKPPAESRTTPAPVAAASASPQPLPTTAAAPALAGSPAPGGSIDLTTPATNTSSSPASGSSILGRWWFWTGIGAVVVAGVAVGLWASRSSGGVFCADCANTAGVSLP
jgi:hypothetical protein